MLNKNLMRIKKYCEPYMLVVFLVIVVLGVLYTGNAKINLQYVKGAVISRADILIHSELLMLRGDSGGRKVAKRHECFYIDVEDEKELFDIDSEKDINIYSQD